MSTKSLIFVIILSKLIFADIITENNQTIMNNNNVVEPFLKKFTKLYKFNSNFDRFEYPQGKNYSACKERLQNLIEKNVDDPLFKPFIEYGGKGLNNLGDYKSCINYPNMAYFVINFYPNPPFPDSYMKIGVCIPDLCTNNTLYFALQDLIKSNIPLIPKTMEIPISVYNSEQFNQNLNKKYFGYYLCVIILALYIIIVLTSTILKILSVWNSGDQVKSEKHKFRRAILILNCFNLKENIEGILKTENRIDPLLNIFQFVRCFGILWVISGHYFALQILNYSTNIFNSIGHVFNDVGMAILRNATLSVDMFFILSGFFSTMAFVSAFENPKHRSIKNILLFYFHRYARLFPMMIICWIISVYLSPVSSDGAFPYRVYNEQQKCKSRFIQSFLYIDNLLNSNEGFCNDWIWYLYVDMQLFILTPFIVYPAFKKAKFGLLTLLILASSSCIYQIFLFQSKDYSADTLTIQSPDFLHHYYYQAYTRCNTYFIGILFCYLYFENKSKPLFNSKFLHSINQLFSYRIVRYTLSLIGCSIMVFAVFSQNWFDHDIQPISQFANTTFLLFDRVLFAFGMMLVIYPILLGFFRPLNSIWGCAFFNVFGKITYGTYMIHLPIIYFLMGKMRNGNEYEFFHLLIDTISTYLISYFCSFILSIIFESPIVQLLKLITQVTNAKQTNNLISLNSFKSLQNTKIQDNPETPENSENSKLEEIKIDEIKINQS